MILLDEKKLTQINKNFQEVYAPKTWLRSRVNSTWDQHIDLRSWTIDPSQTTVATIAGTNAYTFQNYPGTLAGQGVLDSTNSRDYILAKIQHSYGSEDFDNGATMEMLKHGKQILEAGEFKLLASKLNAMTHNIETAGTGTLAANDVFNLLDSVTPSDGNKVYCGPEITKAIRTLNLIGSDGKIQGWDLVTLPGLSNLTSLNKVLWAGDITEAFWIHTHLLGFDFRNINNSVNEIYGINFVGRLTVENPTALKVLRIK